MPEGASPQPGQQPSGSIPQGSSPNGRRLSDEDSKAIQALADRFFEAVSKRDGDGLWEAFSDDARAFVLNKAIEQGMDFDVASALRDGSATEEQRAEYLLNLVEGIRRDLRGVDLGNLTYDLRREPETDQIRVSYLVEVAAGPEGGHRIPAGSLLVSQDEDRWGVDRLVPRPG